MVVNGRWCVEAVVGVHSDGVVELDVEDGRSATRGEESDIGDTTAGTGREGAHGQVPLTPTV